MTRNEERAIEWDCQKVMRQYYHHVDHHEFEDAVKLFTEDVTWKVMGVALRGREELLEALIGGLGNDTIRHVLTKRDCYRHRREQCGVMELHDELLLARRSAGGHGQTAAFHWATQAWRYVCKNAAGRR